MDPSIGLNSRLAKSMALLSVCLTCLGWSGLACTSVRAQGMYPPGIMSHPEEPLTRHSSGATFQETLDYLHQKAAEEEQERSERERRRLMLEQYGEYGACSHSPSTLTSH